MPRWRLSLRLASGELRSHRRPHAGVTAAFPCVDDAALVVDEDEVRLIGGTERTGAVSLRILDRRPGPPVALDERLRLICSVRDVDAEIGDVRVVLLEVCVGDRLALAGASP
jgi:hypothetical protein